MGRRRDDDDLDDDVDDDDEEDDDEDDDEPVTRREHRDAMTGLREALTDAGALRRKGDRRPAKKPKGRRDDDRKPAAKNKRSGYGPSFWWGHDEDTGD